MPAGPSILGFGYFTGAKFLGYTAYSHFLRKKWNDFPEKGPERTFAIGGIRTLIGLGVGISYWLATTGIAVLAEHLWRINGSSQWWGVLFLAGLLPVRLGEWYWLLRIVFRERVPGSPHVSWSLVWGTIVSYALDAIGVAAAFVIPGGIWVC